MPRNDNRHTDDAGRLAADEDEASAEARWRFLKDKGPMSGAEANLEEFADTALAGRRINVGDLVAGLAYLSRITGDDAFLTAALALPDYGLEGGLEAAAKALLRRTGRTTEDFVRPLMDPEMSKSAAARTLAAELGLPGHSLESIQEKLRRKPTLEPEPFPLGNTGRELLVQLRAPLQNLDGRPQSEFFGIIFDPNRCARVPDNREWRRFIRLGVVALHGVEPSTNPALGIF